jgi:hypothetical protein
MLKYLSGDGSVCLIDFLFSASQRHLSSGASKCRKPLLALVYE